LQVNILKRKISSLVKTIRSDVIAIILFGSTVYMGQGRDLDIIVIIPGSFLSGLALGYEVIYDKSQGRIHELIMKMLEELSESEHILVKRYGEWSLHIHAKHLLRRRKSTM